MANLLNSIRLAGFSLLLLASATLSMNSSARAELIGLSLPLSGDVAELGREFRIGARLAMEQFGSGHELFIADDGCDPDLANLALKDMQTQQPAIVTGLLCNEVAIIMANGLRESGTPLLIAGARSVRLTKDREREAWNLFRMSPGDDYAYMAAADAIAKRWRDKPYAIVDDGTIFGRMYTDGLRLVLGDAGLEPQVSDNFRAAQSTQAGLLRRLERSGVEGAFVAAATQEDLVTIARNMQQFGVQLDLITSEQLSTLPYLEEAKEIPSGIGVIKTTISEKQEFVSLTDLLREQKIVPTRQIYEGYAAVQVAIAALGEDKAATINNLATRKFDSVLGPVHFNEAGANIPNPYALHIWNGSTLERANAGTPSTQ